MDGCGIGDNTIHVYDPQVSYSYDSRCIVSPARETAEESHYSDFDYKVISYQGQLAREDTARTSVARSRYER